MKFGAVLGDFTMGASEAVSLGPRVERDYGFDSIWVCDHLVDMEGSVPDPYAIFGYLSAVTSKITMAAAVSDCSRIHPAKMAHIVGTLNEISKGRANLGIGAGEAMNLRPFGIPFEHEPQARRERLREFVQVVRLLWSSSSKKDSRVNFSGKFYALKEAWLDQPAGPKKPDVIIGALGARKTLELTGELADACLCFACTPEYYEWKLGIVNRAAERSGRKPQDVEPIGWLHTVISKDPKILGRAMDTCKFVALWERGSLKFSKIELPNSFVEGSKFQNVLLNDESNINNINKLAASVPDHIAKRMNAIGTVDEVIESVSALQKAGAKHILIDPIVAPAHETLSQFGAKVLPHFR